MSSIKKNFPFDGLHLVDRPWFPYLCTEVEHWEWKTEGEAHYNFWVCLGGEGSLRCAGQTFRLRPGMFFIFSPNQEISAAHFGGTRITRFSAHFVPLDGAVVLHSIPEFPLLGGLITDLAQLKRQIDMIMRLAFRREDELLLHRHLYALVSRACTETKDQETVVVNQTVARAMELMREDPAGIDSMDRLAKRLHCSRSHFDREFSNQVGQPPKQFLLTCKMIEARRLLESTQLRVGEIADRLGYRDIYFFSRQFKAHYKTSPLNYRRGLAHG